MNKPTLTVFTTTYNRAYSLPRGYEALKRQTSKDFKWIIVDDGSTDNTRELVQKWMNEGQIPIEYYYKENGGMHSGHNEAYRHIDTELNVCIDSDDYMTDNAVEQIVNNWRKHGDNDKYAGMIGLDIYHNDHAIIGTSFPDGVKAVKSYELVRKYGVICDKKYVFRTEIIKQYMPYPEYEGEIFTPLNYPYDQICTKYDLLCFNEPWCIVEYQQDGSTMNIFRQYKNNPQGFAYERNIKMNIYPDFRDKLKNAIHYVSCSLFSRNVKLWKANKKCLVFLVYPLGVLLNLYIRYRARQ